MIKESYTWIYTCSECSKEFKTLQAALDHERFEHLCKRCKHSYSAMCEPRCVYDFDCGKYNDKFEELI